MADTIFYNADYIVVEYIDIIKSPYLVLLKYMKTHPQIGEILNIDQIKYLDDSTLVEWYINRKNQNFLLDLNKYPDSISKEDFDNLLDKQLQISPVFYQDADPLIFINTLRYLTTHKLVNDIIIYYPHDYTYAKDDLDNLLNYDFTFMSDFNKVLDLCKENSTYFLSDIDKLLIMKEKGYLCCSSVIIPLEYRYNKINMTEFKHNLDELLRTDVFKLCYMRACTYVELTEEDHKNIASLYELKYNDEDEEENEEEDNDGV